MVTVSVVPRRLGASSASTASSSVLKTSSSIAISSSASCKVASSEAAKAALADNTTRLRRRNETSKLFLLIFSPH